MTRSALLMLLLASTPLAVAAAADQPARPAQPAATTAAAAEDARLNAFLDAAYQAQVALSPQQQTGLGLKTNYDRLDDYTDAGREQLLALRRTQLAEMRAQFDPARLSPAGRVSFRLAENQVQRAEDSKVVEEEEEEGLVEELDKLFVIIVVKLDIFHTTIHTQHIRLVTIADSSTM